ncbi:MAG: ABC transporter substrate-binding protein [Firmicutes bacterium]|nr:ABC transporter substrate-binding protein [Bacillota bacterium]
MRRSKSRLIKLGLFLALAAAMFLLFAGCKKEEPKAEPPKAEQPKAEQPKEPEKPKETLKIGYLGPMTGALGEYGDENVKGLHLYLEQVKYTAGGRPVKVITEDDACDPQTGQQKLRKLIESDKVDILIGQVCSHVTLALADILKNEKKFLVTTTTSTTALSRDQKNPFIYRGSFNMWMVAAPLTKHIVANKDKYGTKGLFVGTDMATTYSVAKDFKDLYLPSGGELVKEMYIPLGTVDYGPFVAEVKRLNPGFIFAFVPGADGARFVKAMGEAALKIPILGVSLMDDYIIPGAGPAAEGLITSAQYTGSLDTPENKEFVRLYKEKYGKMPDENSNNGWDPMRIIVEAVNKVNGDLADENKVREALLGVSFTGARGPIRMSGKGNILVENIYIRQVQNVNGKLQNVVIDTIKDVEDPGPQ